MKWQSIKNAPKGKTRQVAVRGGGTREVHEPEYILAPTSDGKVTITYWVPSAERWCMFTKKCPPEKWMPLPDAETGYEIG